MSWTHESGSKPTADEFRAMGIVPPEDYPAFIEGYLRGNQPSDPILGQDDTRLAGLEEAYALAKHYHKVGMIDFEAALLRIINRIKQANAKQPSGKP